MSKKIKIANKEEDASISTERYGFKGNKKKAYGFDSTINDQYDVDVLEGFEDSREVKITDDEKDANKKSLTDNQKQQNHLIADPAYPEVKINKDKNEIREDMDQKDSDIPKSHPLDPESQVQVLNKEDKEKRKDKEKEKSKEKEQESVVKEKLHQHKDNFVDHNNKPQQDNNSKTPNHLPVQNHANDKKDKEDEKTGTVEKIAVNKDSTDGYAKSLDQVKPIQFIDEVKDAPPVAHGLEVKESKKEEEKLPKLEQPTGLPLKGADSKDKTKEKFDPKDIKLQPEGAKKISPLVDEKHIQDSTPVKLPPLPPINKETGNANQIKFILDTFPTHDKGLNSDFGPVPQINLDGQADPHQNEKFSNEATEQTTEEKAKADLEIKKDFGENNIFPTVKTEILESKHKFSQPVDISSIVNQDTSAFDEATKANFDQKALNKLQQDREKEVQKVMDGKDQKDLKIENEHKLHNEKIAKETLKARKDQEKEQQLAKKSVDKHRQDWEAENQKVKSDFDVESDKKKKETKDSIDAEVKKTDAEINKQVDDANAQVKKHTEEAEQKAKAEKAKADNQPKSFWDRISDAVSDLFDAIKSAINSIFDALRKLVKSVIELAKKAINKLIDYVRDAVIGLIKAFGEVLKALVKIALAAFPSLRDKFIGFIDKAVNAACDVVNAIAEGLKKVVNFLLDALGKVIDMALAFYQAIVNLALDALQVIALGLIKVLKFLSQVGEKLKKFGGLIDSINEVYEHPEILETAAQQTIQPYIDKIPAETEKKLNEGLSAVGLTKHFKGIWKYLAPALSHLASNWWGEAKKMIWFLIWPFAEGSPLYEDAPKLVHLIPQIWKDVWSGDYSKAIDGCLEWMQALNMTLGAFAGWIAIAGVVVGAVIGGVAGAVGGAGVGAIPGAVAGAGAGLELAAAVGEGLLVSMMATEGAVLTKAIYDLLTTEDDENKESTPSSPQTPPNENNNNNPHKSEGPQGGSEQPQLKHYTSGNIKTGHDRIEYAYQRIANSVITLGIMGALFLLGAIGGKIAQGLSNAFKRIAAALDRAAPETMASVRNIASKVSSGVGRITKPVKDFGEKYGDDFGRGQEWMEGKIDDVKGKFGFKKKGGKEGENNNQNENDNNQNNQEDNQIQNQEQNNKQEQNNSEQKDGADLNSKEKNNSSETTNNSENNNSTDVNSNKSNVKDTPGKKNKMETGASKGEEPTPETIRQGTVRMEEHPDYPKLIKHAEEKGFRVEFTEGDPHVSVKEITKLDGSVEVDKVLYLKKEMRFIDLEHEIGHIEQLGRFKETPFTEKLVEFQDKNTGEIKYKANPDQSGILNNWKDSITEYHNRLVEYLRLKERGVDPAILKQHEVGLEEAFEKYRSKGLKDGRSRSQKAWADENFPDIKELEAKYHQSKETASLSEGSQDIKDPEIVDNNSNISKEDQELTRTEEKNIEDKSGQKYLDLAEQAYEKYSKELPEALNTLDEIVGDYGEVTGRAKRPESAANRLERANKNFNKKIETVDDAIDNTWDALGTRLTLNDASPQTIDAMVNDLCEGIKSGKLKVNKVNSLTGKNGNPYLTSEHLQQIKAAGESIDQVIDVGSKEYDTGYTIGAIYVEYPSGVKGEIQIIGKEVLQVANAEHLPYDAILNKPYLDAFKPEFQTEAKSLIDPIRNAAQSLDEGQKAAYYNYLNDCYKNARGMESGGPRSSVPLPEGLPKELSLDNLLNVESATKKFKK